MSDEILVVGRLYTCDKSGRTYVIEYFATAAAGASKIGEVIVIYHQVGRSYKHWLTTTAFREGFTRKRNE